MRQLSFSSSRHSAWEREEPQQQQQWDNEHSEDFVELTDFVDPHRRALARGDSGGVFVPHAFPRLDVSGEFIDEAAASPSNSQIQTRKDSGTASQNFSSQFNILPLDVLRIIWTVYLPVFTALDKRLVCRQVDFLVTRSCRIWRWFLDGSVPFPTQCHLLSHDSAPIDMEESDEELFVARMAAKKNPVCMQGCVYETWRNRVIWRKAAKYTEIRTMETRALFVDTIMWALIPPNVSNHLTFSSIFFCLIFILTFMVLVYVEVMNSSLHLVMIPVWPASLMAISAVLSLLRHAPVCRKIIFLMLLLGLIGSTILGYVLEVKRFQKMKQWKFVASMVPLLAAMFVFSLAVASHEITVLTDFFERLPPLRPMFEKPMAVVALRAQACVSCFLSVAVVALLTVFVALAAWEGDKVTDWCQKEVPYEVLARIPVSPVVLSAALILLVIKILWVLLAFWGRSMFKHARYSMIMIGNALALMCCIAASIVASIPANNFSNYFADCHSSVWMVVFASAERRRMMWWLLLSAFIIFFFTILWNCSVVKRKYYTEVLFRLHVVHFPSLQNDALKKLGRSMFVTR